MANENQHSTDLNAAEAAARVGELGSGDEVLAFIDGDERLTVRRAADARLTELGEAATAAPIDERARPGSPLEAGGQGQKRVRTRFPVDRFEHGIDGVPVITATGVDVDADKLEELIELARVHDTPLEEVDA